MLHHHHPAPLHHRNLPKVVDYYSEDHTNEDNSDEILDLIDVTKPVAAIEYEHGACLNKKTSDETSSERGALLSDSAPLGAICDSKVGQSLEAMQKYYIET